MNVALMWIAVSMSATLLWALVVTALQMSGWMALILSLALALVAFLAGLLLEEAMDAPRER